MRSSVSVTLEEKQGSVWKLLNTATTNQQGRISAFYTADTKLEKGTYRVTFMTGAWFKQHKAETFFSNSR